MSAGGSVTRTIRIDKETDGFLESYSEKERVSVNFLVNKALRKFVEWDVYAEKFGYIEIPSSLAVKMMGYLSDDQARELGRWVGKNLVREYITFWFKEVTLQTLIKGYPRLEAQYGRAFQYEEHSEGGRWVIILKHGKGPKWSVYYEEIIRAIFEDLGKAVKTERTDDQVIARFSFV